MSELEEAFAQLRAEHEEQGKRLHTALARVAERERTEAALPCVHCPKYRAEMEHARSETFEARAQLDLLLKVIRRGTADEVSDTAAELTNWLANQ